MGLMQTVKKSKAAWALIPSSAGAQDSVACCSIQCITLSWNWLSLLSPLPVYPFSFLPSAGNLYIPPMSTLQPWSRKIERKG